MVVIHPLVKQLKFTRAEFLRGISGVPAEDARKRLLPMNCISWNVGHLAWQEQRYFLYFTQGKLLFPEINQAYAYRAPACTPPLDEVVAAWQAITTAADAWLETLTSEKLLGVIEEKYSPARPVVGNLLQRVIYHYWYHNGENQAIRQMLGHSGLPEFVGDIDEEAPYTPETNL